MDSRAADRFALRDAMILIAAVAIATALARVIWRMWKAEVAGLHGNLKLMPMFAFELALSIISIFVVFIQIALLVSSAIADRRTLRVKLESPGFAASFATLLAIGYELVRQTPRWLSLFIGAIKPNYFELDQVFAFIVIELVEAPATSLILCLWAIQACQRRFQFEAAWREWMGLALGLYWISSPIVRTNLWRFLGG